MDPKILLPFVAFLSLSGCAQTWQTSYDEGVTKAESSTWRLNSVNVTVPDSLSVSEVNGISPDADIVWREEPRGDRRAQVQKIMSEAVEKGAEGLSGKRRDVDINVVLSHFHAITPIARAQLQSSGVHNIGFYMSVSDARSGEILVSETEVAADLPAYVGEQSIAAIARGETQRVRIVEHVSAVTAGWLGVGPDVRTTFTRRGR